MSQNAANLTDAGITIVGSSVAGGLAAYSSFVNAASVSASEGLSAAQILTRADGGARALNMTDFGALEGQGTSDLAKMAMIESGVNTSGASYQLTTTFSQRLSSAWDLWNTGSKALGSLGLAGFGFAGGAATAASDGGFVLYPNKSNNNGLTGAYRK
jgi:hypothetical protein